MFAKPYKLKSTNTLKNTEKKSLVKRIQNQFPAVSEQRVKELVPAKSNTSCLRLILYSDEAVNVYVVDNVPMFIDLETKLVPTVCALWKVPELVPTITIHAPVLGKILGGAPLYLPGVEIPQHGIGFPMFAAGTWLAANTTDNAAAAVVGRAAISSADMLMRVAGVCLEVVHVFGDQLCKDEKFNKIERPHLDHRSSEFTEGPQLLATSFSELHIHPPREEWPSLGRPLSSPPVLEPPPTPAAPLPQTLLNDDNGNDSMDETEEQQIPEDMDGLLRWCLLCFLRLEGKTIELPLKTSLLYRNYLVPLCPPDRTLDVKKSTFKKMGKFLEAMQREGLVEVKELEKGVDAVVAVNVCHPCVRAVRAARRPPPPAAPVTDYRPPSVREMLCITAAVMPLFPGLKKGTAVTPAEVRVALTQYVKSRAPPCAAPAPAAPRGSLVLDRTLAAILGKQDQEVVKWDALMAGVQAKMTAATELRHEGGEARLLKTRLQPVTMQVVTRSGNKKVTLVSNLEAYGFSLGALASSCQHGAGASCGVTRPPGARCDQLMLQGDQTHFMVKLLVEKYGLPKKFVENADKILAKKK